MRGIVTALIHYDAVACLIPWRGCHLGQVDHCPLLGRDSGKLNVPWRRKVDMGDVKPVGAVDELRIKLATADERQRWRHVVLDLVGQGGQSGHQPVEQLAALRAIPGVIVIRPADANEVAETYKTIMPLTKNPAALVLTRQNLPTLDRSRYASAAGLHQGAYVLADAKGGRPDVILIGTGSEVSICVQAYETLTAEGIKTRVVSMPSWELFDAQPVEYQDAVLPPAVTARVAVEAGVEMGWGKYLGFHGRFVGMSGFGTSSPVKVVLEHFGFTPANVVAEAKAAIAAARCG